MTNENNLTWGAVVPLIGGMCFGAQRALGGKPQFLASYPDSFGANDAYARRYYPESPYIDIETDEIKEHEGVDVVLSLCPCAGLSSASFSKRDSEQRLKQNDWMIKAAERTIKTLKPKVIIGENAPRLFTPVGRQVRDNMMEIAVENGYVMSFLRTSTYLHGIPQKRNRTFYYMFKDERAPILARIRRPMFIEGNATELATEFFDGLELHDDQERLTARTLVSQPYYRYLFEKYGDQWRTLGGEHEVIGSMLAAVCREEGGLDAYIAWAEATGADEGDDEWWYKLAVRFQEKHKLGKGVLDVTSVLPEKGMYRSIMWKTFRGLIHPTEDRLLNKAEVAALMGIPLDFELPTSGASNIMCQNVPGDTAMHAVHQVRLWVNGKLESSGGIQSWTDDKSGNVFEGPERKIVKGKKALFVVFHERKTVTAKKNDAQEVTSNSEEGVMPKKMTETEKVDTKVKNVPGQVQIVVLVEPGSGAMLGILDADKKKFQLLPGADLPIGDTMKYCDHIKEDPKTKLHPSAFVSGVQAIKHQELMSKIIKGASGNEYAVYILPFKVFNH